MKILKKIVQVWVVIGGVISILDTCLANLFRAFNRDPLGILSTKGCGYADFADNVKRIAVTVFLWPYLAIKSAIVGITHWERVINDLKVNDKDEGG